MNGVARHLVIGAVAMVIVAAMGALASRQQPDVRGWRQLQPSAMHWFALWVSLGLTMLMAWVRLFVGSTRPDGPQQMQILSWLIAAFALGTVISAVTIVINRRRAIRWRGREIAFHGPDGSESRKFAQIAAIARDGLGQVVLRFEDGGRLRIDPYAQGAAQLIDAVQQSRLNGGAAR